MTKYVAIAAITDITAVQAKCKSMGLGDADKGSIFINIPELGFEGSMMIYCRYGMSIPYIKVIDGDKLWVEPTLEGTERWIYTGFADCGNSDAEPTTTSRLTIPLESGIFTITFGENITIEGDADAKTINVTCGQSEIAMEDTKVTVNGNLEVLI